MIYRVYHDDLANAITCIPIKIVYLYFIDVSTTVTFFFFNINYRKFKNIF